MKAIFIFTTLIFSFGSMAQNKITYPETKKSATLTPILVKKSATLIVG